MPGFSHDAQNEVATLVLAHRRKLRPSRFEQLPADRTEADLRLCVLLRLAVRLCRHRNDDGIPRVRLEAPDKNTLRVLFESGALEDNPLTRVDLEDEKKRLESGDIELQVDEQE
jgi:exopolyphosphatase/guanosine-5'-triphosphate,3'-diphosphate pyrophosphatase